MHLRRSMHWSLSNKIHLLDETNELYRRSTSTTSQERSIRKRLGRRRRTVKPVSFRIFSYFSIKIFNLDFTRKRFYKILNKFVIFVAMNCNELVLCKKSIPRFFKNRKIFWSKLHSCRYIVYSWVN